MSAGAVATDQAASSPRPKRPHLTDRARSERRLAFMLVGPAALVMVLVTAYPLIETVILSLQRADLRFPGANKFIGLSNFGHVLSAPIFRQDLLHTVIITVISVSIQFVLGMLLALAMHRVIFARGTLRAIALIRVLMELRVVVEQWLDSEAARLEQRSVEPSVRYVRGDHHRRGLEEHAVHGAAATGRIGAGPR
jgi:multiple sugar transport system permease protein